MKIESLEKKHETFCVKVYDSQTYPKFVQSKLINLENRSRRNNVSIYGVTERNYETLDKREEYVEQVFTKKLGLKYIRVERVHRMKRKKGYQGKKLEQ